VESRGRAGHKNDARGKTTLEPVIDESLMKRERERERERDKNS